LASAFYEVEGGDHGVGWAAGYYASYCTCCKITAREKLYLAIWFELSGHDVLLEGRELGEIDVAVGIER
jgi:hypothetical protein